MKSGMSANDQSPTIGPFLYRQVLAIHERHRCIRRLPRYLKLCSPESGFKQFADVLRRLSRLSRVRAVEHEPYREGVLSYRLRVNIDQAFSALFIDLLFQGRSRGTGGGEWH